MNIPQITFSRFVAAMGVVIYHYGLLYAPFDRGLLHDIVSEMYLAVSYFFLLSGFIMAVVYWDGASGGRVAKRRYWLARVSRIHPLYWFALLLSSAVVVALIHSRPDPVGFALSALGLQAWIPRYSLVINFPGWSLSVEIFFYVILLPMLVRLKTKPLLAVAFGFWAATGLVFYLMASNLDPSDGQAERFVRYWPPLHLSTFLFGAAWGIVYRRGLHRYPLPPFVPPLLFVGSMAVFVALLAVPNPLVKYSHNGLLSPLFMIAIIGMSMDRTWLARVLAWKPLEFLGEISYGVYILQFPIYELYSWAIGVELGHAGTHYYVYDNGLHFFGYAAALVAASALSFVAIEKPVKAFIRRRLMPRRARA
jgi:peptidoglycan/LPS O-acetylase OafA/YrhL